ncbi:MAG: sigma-70 family RNA polymerase sigma factor [Clostridia bacterium]|nr:sigma-70 family RNA polymerase sigma factor [Clostridia bacterium]
MEINQQTLIKKAARGDSAAFEALLAGHEKMMYAIALRMTRNAEDAKDCLQDAMLRIYKALPSFRGESTFSTWVYRVVTNTCLDSHRRKKVRRSESLDALNEAGWNAPDTAKGPEETAENSGLRSILSVSLNKLPVEIRSAVVLRDVQGFSYEEISDILQINIGTVKSRISRGREKLREMLAPYMELN